MDTPVENKNIIYCFRSNFLPIRSFDLATQNDNKIEKELKNLKLVGRLYLNWI